MGRIIIYNHGGSANHGCEALVRTVHGLIDSSKEILIVSECPQEDYHYDLHELGQIRAAKRNVGKLNIDFIKAYIQLKLTGDYFEMDKLPFLKEINEFYSDDIVVSIGGDIYCYDDYPKFIRLHELIAKKGCKSILLGCSMNENLFDDPAFVADMERYDYISARETLTFDLLKKAGLKKIGYAPDSAFTLKPEYLPLPSQFIEGNTVGINLSPLVEQKEKKSGSVLLNYQHLVEWILNHTDMNVALIPHVVWNSNDDRESLKEIYDIYRENSRVIMLQDCNCMQLKGYISKLRFFVGARTHATIAAYSSSVPTLVVGYSIKSKGIAKDLFGTDQNYVIPVSDLNSADKLTTSFKWIYDNEEMIKKQLSNILPDYVKKAQDVKIILKELIGD